MRGLLWKFIGADRLPEKAKKNLGIVALLYFIQGAPVAILWEVLPVYFRLHGVPLRVIGGLRLLELPYSLNVDRNVSIGAEAERGLVVEGDAER